MAELGDRAKLHLRIAVKTAIDGLRKSVADCGTLAHFDSKLSPAAKEYFEDQIVRDKIAIQELLEFQASL